MRRLKRDTRVAERSASAGQPLSGSMSPDDDTIIVNTFNVDDDDEGSAGGGGTALSAGAAGNAISSSGTSNSGGTYIRFIDTAQLINRFMFHIFASSLSLCPFEMKVRHLSRAAVQRRRSRRLFLQKEER